jgi:prepilin-type N-terminal cleavage/methylation domain-containing protein
MIKFFSNKLRNRKGFTLVELLIVIAVLGILAGIAVPRMTGITDEFKRQADVQTGEAVARQVEVFILAGKYDVSDLDAATDTQAISEGTGAYGFGEDFPPVQFKSGDIKVNIKGTATDDLYEIEVLYSDDAVIATRAAVTIK